MNNCLGLIMTEGKDTEFGELTYKRPLTMLPFGGRYRLVDFTLSNMVNNGINTIAVYTGEKARSTMDHLGNGKPWDLNRRFTGLFIFPPLYSQDEYSKHGDLGELQSTESFFIQAKERYVLLADPAYLSKVNLQKAFNAFLESGADVGMVYANVTDPEGQFFHATKLHIDENKKIVSMGYNLGYESSFNMHLGLTFLKKSLLGQIVYESIELGTAKSLRDALINNITRLRIVGIPHKGNVEYIRNTANFYRANMNLLNEDIYNELFFEGGPILTKAKDEPSTFYGDEARVSNSLIANGCIIEGEVINSIIFRGVNIGKGTLVKNSILMQKTIVGEEAAIINTITDKYVEVDSFVTIAGTQLSPYIAQKGQKIRKE